MSVPKLSTPCWYFQQGRCWYTDAECRFTHTSGATLPSGRTGGQGAGGAVGFATTPSTSTWSKDDLDYLDSSERYSAKDVKPDSLFGNWRTSRRKQNIIGAKKSKRKGRKKAYSEPTFTDAERRWFSKTEQWDENRLDGAGIKELHFGPDFTIQDDHLAAICSRPNLASSLVKLSLGNSDSGNGSSLTDGAVIDLVTVCSNFRVLKLESATRLTDAAFSAICDACLSLEFLSITGNDKISGMLTASSLEKLKASREVSKNLQKLVLYDQMSCSRAQVEKLSKARRDLTIEAGNSVGDGVADYMIAQMMGGETTETWLGGKVIQVCSDGGFNFPVHDDDDADGYDFVMDFPDWAGGDIPAGY